MEAVASPVRINRPLAPEDQGRADFYALFSRLMHAAPDARLLGAISIASEIPPEGDPALAKAWGEFVSASSVMDADAADDEYQALFVGVGASQVSIYSGFYTGATAVDHPRIRLRADLADLFLAKPDHIAEPDDHYAVLFDAMRVLIAGGAGRSSATLAEQKHFFQAHLEPGVVKFFRALGAADGANYYRRVAALGLAFMAIESESFRLG
ncbi:TorD/DmsD family molecular chaperone [Usitatibacter palustris]|uniref:Chaperone protein TorD n=1 Tax=Usitatibacter palustris TaxID=2732487 RepID=A0A6M4HC52_9PROT|nr:molecular chaperone TorD family protein [Usitatibacter palustris]QJR15577.1 Chaperone protein TorD [Usitatibacter palustris]